MEGNGIPHMLPQAALESVSASGIAPSRNRTAAILTDRTPFGIRLGIPSRPPGSLYVVPGTRERSTKSAFEGRSARRRMYQGNQRSP